MAIWNRKKKKDKNTFVAPVMSMTRTCENEYRQNLAEIELICKVNNNGYWIATSSSNSYYNLEHLTKQQFNELLKFLQKVQYKETLNTSLKGDLT
ncbi:MAG: hypothetical protein AABY22_03455 [Nanoarchaeota archaeon]